MTNAASGTRVNEFTIRVATVNGTGSQSANLALMRAIAGMGITVTAKNIFPSNIQGMPTWYELRVSGAGYRSRSLRSDILVCMNQDSLARDLAGAAPGTLCLVRDTLVHAIDRKDLDLVSFPADQLVKAAGDVGKLRKQLVNFVYVGVLAEYLGIEAKAMDAAVSKVFDHKPKAVELNQKALAAGAGWVREQLKGPRRFRVEALRTAEDRIVIDGNEAAALGALFGGCTVIPWYPITPASSVCESAGPHFERWRKEPDGKGRYAILQVEDELAAIGMALGAGWAGARSMTATSGPGISLMAEFAGLGYFTETPTVVIDVQRMGPSTGLPTRTAQGDMRSVYHLSHGDTRHIMLIPKDPTETFTMVAEAFDLADRFQTPVFVMMDLDLGMNPWQTRAFDYPAKPLDRGKLLDAAALSKLPKFERYRDVDGDGIPYRTVPGTDHPAAAWFARGTGHTPSASYSEDPDNYRELLERLERKFDGARKILPQPEIRLADGARIGVISYGTSSQAVDEAADRWGKAGTPVSTLRLRSLPFDQQVIRTFAQGLVHVYVVEQNRDHQVADILKAELPELAPRIRSVLSFDGMPLAAQFVHEDLARQEGWKSPWVTP